MPQVDELATDALFTQYLHVVNRSLGMNRHLTPYKQILKAGETFFDEGTVAVGIYKDDLSKAHDWFTVEFDDGTFALEQHGKSDDADLVCKVKESHLHEVVENPREYVEKPYKLDLDWLKRTLRWVN